MFADMCVFLSVLCQFHITGRLESLRKKCKFGLVSKTAKRCLAVVSHGNVLCDLYVRSGLLCCLNMAGLFLCFSVRQNSICLGMRLTEMPSAENLTEMS